MDNIELFYLGQNIDITEIDKGNNENYYSVQIEKGNAYYYITSDMEIEEFKNILNGIVFKNI